MNIERRFIGREDRLAYVQSVVTLIELNSNYVKNVVKLMLLTGESNMPEPKIEEITHFEFTYTPMFDGTTNIRYVTVNVYAKDRKEAELVAHNEAWKFFNLDLRCSVEEKRHGYARTNKDT